MIAYETCFVYDERRYRLRHGLEVEIPGDRGGVAATREDQP